MDHEPMLNITLNGEPKTLQEPLTVTQLLECLGHDSRRVAVEVNREVVPLPRHPAQQLNNGDAVEIVTLVGGGAGENEPPPDKPLVIGKFTFRSRLITGTGKYATYELMRDCLAASDCEVTTVAVRRERLVDKHGRLLQRRGRDSPRPAGPRVAYQPRQPRGGLGQAGVPRRSEDPAARPAG